MVPNISPTFKPSELGSVEIIQPDSILITNKATVASVEASHVLQENLSELFIRSRNFKKFKLSLISGGQFLTVEAGCNFRIEGLKLNTTTVYLTSMSDDVLEIVETYLL